jgi:O-antigen ligase
MKPVMSIVGRVWNTALSIAFTGLCIRFIGAAFVETVGDNWSAPLLVILTATCSFFAPFPVLFAFTASLPLLAGLGRTSMLPIPEPPSLVFCSIWLGYQARLALGTLGRRGKPSLLALTGPATASRYPLFCTNFLISAIVVSAVIQAFLYIHPADWIRAFKQPSFSFSDPLYFMDAAFVWLQGLFFFRYLWNSEVHSAQDASGSHTRTPTTELGKQLWDAGPTRYWIRPVFGIYAVTIAVFLAMQYVLNFPVGWVAAGYFSPFEDISSFGSITASILIFWFAAFRGNTVRYIIMDGAICVVMVLAVIASWSRASWLSGTCFLLIACWLRFPRKWSLSVVVIVGALVAIGNFEGNRPSWRENEYLARFVSLVRLENPANKDAGRINLYHKALGMIEARPLYGHMIGSFYLTSTKYAAAGDPYATRPDFAHNAVIQVAAELGVPIAVLFSVFCGFTLYIGFSKCSVSSKWTNPGKIGTQAPSSMSYFNAKILPLLGANLALAVYLATQMTANSLNVYPTNQFFFWFLMALILFYPRNPAGASAERLQGW